MKTKFSQLSKKDKTFRVVNLCVMCALIAANVAITLSYLAWDEPTKKLLAGFAISLCFLVPYLYELIFRTRISNVLFLGIEIYLLFAGLLGSMVRLYEILSWYDIVVHTIMGYLVAMLGIFFISRLTSYRRLSPVAVAFFCLFFSLGVELLWEISEYIIDLTVGQTMQGPKVDFDEYGNFVPLVTDTILDFCCNLTGSLIFFTHFLVGKYSKHSLGVTTIERELAKNSVAVKLIATGDDATEIKSAQRLHRAKVKKQIYKL